MSTLAFGVMLSTDGHVVDTGTEWRHVARNWITKNEKGSKEQERRRRKWEKAWLQNITRIEMAQTTPISIDNQLLKQCKNSTRIVSRRYLHTKHYTQCIMNDQLRETNSQILEICTPRVHQKQKRHKCCRWSTQMVHHAIHDYAYDRNDIWQFARGALQFCHVSKSSLNVLKDRDAPRPHTHYDGFKTKKSIKLRWCVSDGKKLAGYVALKKNSLKYSRRR